MFITIITFVVILGVLILIHEMGHFLSARAFGVKAEEFGFGYPPRIFGYVKGNDNKWKRVGKKEDAADYKNTVWSLNWLPLGGFVRIKGEDGQDKDSPDHDSFSSRPVYQRFIMLFAGVFMNFLFCFLLLTIGFTSGIPTMVDDNPDPSMKIENQKVVIMSVEPDSPAFEAGLIPGDRIFQINGTDITAVSQTQDLISQSQDNPMEIVVFRGETMIDRELTPVLDEDRNRALIGIGLVKTATVRYKWYQSIYKAGQNTVGLTVAIITGFGRIISDLFSGNKVSAEVAGPIGIAVLTGQVVQLGWIYILQFAALLSLNLAIINLLPIPALDGGRILFIIIEKIKGSPVRQSLEARIHQYGFLFILVLMAVVIFNDVRNYGAKIWGAISSLFS